MPKESDDQMSLSWGGFVSPPTTWTGSPEQGPVGFQTGFGTPGLTLPSRLAGGSMFSSLSPYKLTLVRSRVGDRLP